MVRGGLPFDFLIVGFNRYRCKRLVSRLGRREKQILTALAGGKMRKEIAADLGLSIHTINAYLHSTYRKLYVQSNVMATRVAVSAQLV